MNESIHPERRQLLRLAAALGVAASTGASFAADPAGVVRYVVPGGGGGNLDIPLRHVTDWMVKNRTQAAMVENRPGAGGALAADTVAKAPPDGRTWLMTPSQVTTLKVFNKSLSFDPATDLVAAASLSTSEFALVVPANSAIKDVRDWQRALAAKPGQVSYVSAGVGSAGHLGMMMLEQAAGVSALHVPLKSGPEITNYLIGGLADFTFQPLAALLPYVQSRQLRVLAVSSKQRMPLVRDVPTLAETITPGFAYGTWVMFFAPRGTPRPLLEQFNADMQAYLADPSAKALLERLNATPAPMGLDECQAFYAEETRRMVALASKVTATAGK